MSVYGISTEQDCKKKFNELLALNREAAERMTKESISEIKSAL